MVPFVKTMGSLVEHNRTLLKKERFVQLVKIYTVYLTNLLLATYCFASCPAIKGLPSPGPMRTSAKICFGLNSTGVTFLGWSGIFFSSF